MTHKLRTTEAILDNALEQLVANPDLDHLHWKKLCCDLGVSVAAQTRRPQKFREEIRWRHQPSSFGGIGALQALFGWAAEHSSDLLHPDGWDGWSGMPRMHWQDQAWFSQRSVQIALALSYSYATPAFGHPAEAIDAGLDVLNGAEGLLKADTGTKRLDLEARLGLATDHKRTYMEARTALFERYFLLLQPPLDLGTWQGQFRALLQDLDEQLLESVIEALWRRLVNPAFVARPTSRSGMIHCILLNTGLDHLAFFADLPVRVDFGARGRGLDQSDDGEPSVGGRDKRKPIKASKLELDAALSALSDSMPELRTRLRRGGSWRSFIETWLAVATVVLKKTDRRELYAPAELGDDHTADGYRYIRWRDDQIGLRLMQAPPPDADPIIGAAGAEDGVCACYYPFHSGGRIWGIKLHADSVYRRTQAVLAANPACRDFEAHIAACFVYADFHHEFCHYLVEDAVCEQEATQGVSLYATDSENTSPLEESLCEGYTYRSCFGAGRRDPLVRQWLRAFRGEVRRSWPEMPAEYANAHANVEQDGYRVGWQNLMKAYATAGGIGEEGENLRPFADRRAHADSATLKKADVPLWLGHGDENKRSWLLRILPDLRDAAIGHWSGPAAD